MSEREPEGGIGAYLFVHNESNVDIIQVGALGDQE